jgi:hypothetical protein
MRSTVLINTSNRYRLDLIVVAHYKLGGHELISPSRRDHTTMASGHGGQSPASSDSNALALGHRIGQVLRDPENVSSTSRDRYDV